MRFRPTFVIAVLAVLAAALLYTLLPGAGGLSLVIATSISGVFGLVDAFLLLREYVLPDKKLAPSRPTQPATEATYLQGRLAEFDKEEKWFVELAGNAVIETRFAVEEAEFEDIGEAVEQFPQFALIGDPGAGKSTSLRHLARDAALAFLATDGNTGLPLPLWINLGLGDNPTDAADLLEFWCSRYQLPYDAENYLVHNRVWLFLDGLNEVPEQNDKRKKLAASLRGFLAEHKNIRAIVTCRVRNYEDDLDLGLPIVRVQSLDEARSQAFIDKRLPDSDLWAKIEDDDALQRMASNPYSLVMLIELYASRGQLPTDLNDLYSLSVRVRHDEYVERGLVRLPWDVLERKLQRLAFRMRWIAHDKGTVAEIRWAQRQIGRNALRDGIDLGALVQDGETIRFFHQSLRGYFALPDLQKTLHKRWRLRLIVAVVILSVLESLVGIINRLNESVGSKFDSFLLGDFLGNFFERFTNRPYQVIQQIGDLGEAAAPAVPALIDALHDEHYWVRLEARLALGNIGEAAVPALIDALTDENWKVRSDAAEALEKINTPKARAALKTYRKGQ